MQILHREALSFLKNIDPVFQQILNNYGIPPSWIRPEGFETMCQIILEQQVSLESGRAAYLKLSERVKEFSPGQMIRLSKEEMREASISRQKATYIQGLAHDILNGHIDLKSLKKKSRHECMRILTSIKGIGPWTAEVYILFALRDPDIYPRGDIALINTIKELWQVKNAEEALLLSASWSPYRSTASFLLWHHYLRKRGRVAPI